MHGELLVARRNYAELDDGRILCPFAPVVGYARLAFYYAWQIIRKFQAETARQFISRKTLREWPKRFIAPFEISLMFKVHFFYTQSIIHDRI